MMDSTQATKHETAVIDSGVIDNRLLIATNEWMQKKIERAKYALKIGLRKAAVGQHGLAKISFQAALDELKGIGES